MKPASAGSRVLSPTTDCHFIKLNVFSCYSPLRLISFHLYGNSDLYQAVLAFQPFRPETISSCRNIDQLGKPALTAGTRTQDVPTDTLLAKECSNTFWNSNGVAVQGTPTPVASSCYIGPPMASLSEEMMPTNTGIDGEGLCAQGMPQVTKARTRLLHRQLFGSPFSSAAESCNGGASVIKK